MENKLIEPQYFIRRMLDSWHLTSRYTYIDKIKEFRTIETDISKDYANDFEIILITGEKWVSPDFDIRIIDNGECYANKD
jgi:hypothetical protein